MDSSLVNVLLDSIKNFKININNNDEHIRDIEITFFLIFKNVYIRRLIYKHVNLYEIAFLFWKHNIESLECFQYRNYLTRLKFKEEIFNYNRLTISNKTIPYGVVKLIINQDLSISPGDLPCSINTLIFGNRYKSKLELSMLPSSITSFRLSKNTDISLILNKPIPKTIKSLHIKKSCQFDLLKLKNSIEYLNIEECNEFSTIPSTIKTLVLRSGFNSYLPEIPPSVEELIIGNSFKKTIKFSQLVNLKQLIIGKLKTISKSNLYYFENYFCKLLFLKIYMDKSDFDETIYIFKKLEILYINNKEINVYDGIFSLI